MTIAILYICTGKYAQFFDSFYRSAEQYLLSGIRKTYFVFTDDTTLKKADNVRIVRRTCQGFPMDSLMRFDMFLSIAEELRAYDYTFFLNANMQLVAPVGREILPEHLAAVIHPGYYDKPAWRYPYERNRQSTAYIPAHGRHYRYYMGSLNGGKTDEYLEMAAECSRNIHEDLQRGIVARYHDESHLNHYLRHHHCTPLSPAYAYIEGKNMPFEARIIIRDKTRLDPYFDKGRDHSLSGKIKKGAGIIADAIKWYL